MDLATLEQKAFRNHHQMGLRFMYIGVLILSMGVIPLLESFGMHRYIGYLLFVGVPMIAFILIDKKICKPRMGYVKFSSSRQRKIRNSRYFAGVSSVGILILMFITIFWDLPAIKQSAAAYWGIIAALSIIVIVIFAGIGTFMSDWRFVFIGMIFAISFPVNELLGKVIPSPWENVIVFATIGVVLIAMGAVDFIRFLHNTGLAIDEMEIMENGK